MEALAQQETMPVRYPGAGSRSLKVAQRFAVTLEFFPLSRSLEVVANEVSDPVERCWCRRQKDRQ